MCRSTQRGTFRSATAAADDNLDSQLATLSSASTGDEEKVNMYVLVNGTLANCPLDTGAKHNHIDNKFRPRAKIDVIGESNMKVDLAVKGTSVKTQGVCSTSVDLQGREYSDVNFSIMDGLLWDVILGRDFLCKHKSVSFMFDGPQPPLNLGALKPLKGVEPARLFEHLTPSCKLVTSKRRNYSKADRSFISNQVQQLVDDDIIEPSLSPWRAQVVLVKGEHHKKRMCIDYSETINKYTYLDAYALPNVQNIINEVSQYKWFLTLDLRSAYYQVLLLLEEKKYTAFEADGRLYQFKRIPFGLKNAVPCFQRIVNEIISKFACIGTFAYLDDITICGHTREEHDDNLKVFLKAAEECNLTLNEDKCVYAVNSIKLLGYQISDGILQPDTDRVAPIVELPAPTHSKELQRIVGMFSYYARWLPKFSDKIKPLINAVEFPLSNEAEQALKLLKNDLATAALHVIDEHLPFVIETDASDNAVSATLNQENCPVAIYSRMLNKSEKYHSSIEKEACAIVEAVKKWEHFLSGRHFKIITDQKSVSFMYGSTSYGKIENEKTMRWRMLLSEFDFEIVYRAGKFNNAPDALSRAYCASMYDNTLTEIHKSLCHPGITRFYHFVRMKNLPYFIDDVRKVVNKCRLCAEIKPNFYKPPNAQLVKATQPLERLSLDFKGSLPSSSKNRYILTIVDEFSRFPYAFPCSNIDAKTVIAFLNQLFAIFGMPSYVHTDRAATFLLQDLLSFFRRRGIACSRTSVYNAPGNGQCERYNGVIWSAIRLALRSRKLDIRQ